jgi:hypothetical protein
MKVPPFGSLSRTLDDEASVGGAPPHGRHCFASDTLSLKVVVVGAGQDSLPEQLSITELAAVPDIAALLVATIVHTAVKVVVIVFPPEGRRPTKVKVIVTALPETEPLIELVRMATSLLNGNWTVPEIDEPV